MGHQVHSGHSLLLLCTFRSSQTPGVFAMCHIKEHRSQARDLLGYHVVPLFSPIYALLALFMPYLALASRHVHGHRRERSGNPQSAVARDRVNHLHMVDDLSRPAEPPPARLPTADLHSPADRGSIHLYGGLALRLHACACRTSWTWCLAARRRRARWRSSTHSAPSTSRTTACSARRWRTCCRSMTSWRTGVARAHMTYDVLCDCCLLPPFLLDLVHRVLPGAHPFCSMQTKAVPRHMQQVHLATSS